MEVVLDERISRDLEEHYRKLFSEGKIHTAVQLTEYSNAFQSRFGPDRLRNMDGETLLETIHGNSQDSLPYWLEYKNDQEFSTGPFGGLAGISAFKFGLFCRKETGIWTTGTPVKPVEISVQQAIEIAREDRNQLLEGCKLLESMPINGTYMDYENLQRNMDRLAPKISNSTWGHKYFSILYPDQLDPIHIFSLQRYYLIKLLQIPPHNGGRYLAPGWFVPITQKLDISLNNFMHVMYDRNGFVRNYWRIGTSGTAPRNRWELMRDGNCVAIGWADLGDISKIVDNNDGKEIIRQALQLHYPNTPSVLTNIANQIFKFVSGVFGSGMYGNGKNQGDLVLASDGVNVLGIGEIVGNYYFEPSSDFPHRRPIKWLSLKEWRQPDVEGLQTTVYLMKKDVNLIETERYILDGLSKSEQPEPPPEPLFNAPQLTDIPAHIQAVLERKGQVILYGPPGTGKTYWAENAARELAARTNFNRAFEQLTEKQQVLVLGSDNQERGFVRLCSFHPAYGYEDFLEGFRPESSDGQMHFTLRDGIFKKLCNDAEKQPDHKFYLIIDEINRGDIPRIFGELLTVLEKDKRGKAILLPLTGMEFRVPSNVFIIGTMNTADRSIALLDTALRRRFGFIELMPDISILGDAMVDRIPLGLWLQALNESICKYIGRDARNLQIGHSYLLEKGRPVSDFATFAKILREDILPLLEEYCYDDYVTLEKILGPGMVDLKKQQIREELFDETNQDSLIQALLASASDITTSKPAISSEAKAVEEEEEVEENEPGEQLT
jgi:5-methylcytosine-specific restriction protein B